MMDNKENKSTDEQKELPTAMVAVRLPVEMNRKLTELNVRTGISKSAYIKLALSDLLRKLES